MTGKDPSVHELVALLAPTLGEERAREAVTGAVRAAGTADADAVLAALAATPGVVGVAARFAQARLPREEVAAAEGDADLPVPVASSRPGGVSTPRGPARTVDLADLCALLAPSLGDEKSAEIVGAALDAMGAPRTNIDLSRALAVLERLATAEGIVGVAGSFAKARLILLFKR